MANFYDDNTDLIFQIEHMADWETLLPMVERDFMDAKEYKESGDANLEFAPSNVQEALDSYREIYNAYGTIVGDELAPHVAAMDKEGLSFNQGKVDFPDAQKKFVKTLADAGLLGYSIDRAYGGLGLGMLAAMPMAEISARADAGTGIIVGYFNMAEVINRFGDEEMKKEYMPRFARGEYLGAMALTEPNYGSDLSQITTKAIKNDDGTYSITGTKRFITQGCGFGEDVKAAIFTIARSTDAAGARGVSFFLVESDDVEVSRLEDKMGLHISATCELVYENAKGRLIGEEGKGLMKYAMAMMNGARLGIACQSLGIAQAAYEQARKYASERVQFGTEIENIPAVARLLDESEARVQASRALVYRAADAVDRYDSLVFRKEAEGKDDRSIRKDPEVAKWDKLAKIMTPLSKLTASEFCCTVAYDAVQVHGGVGYTEEFEIARIYRDARITTIYEGTSQLQVVAAIGGVIEGVTDNSTLNKYMGERLATLSDAAVKERIGAHWNELKESVELYKKLSKEEKEKTAWDVVWHFSYTFTELLLAEQAEVARRKGLELLADKERVLKNYMLIAARNIAACKAQVVGVAQMSVQPVA